jgi:hypothetical protein
VRKGTLLPRRVPNPRIVWPPCAHAATECDSCFFQRQWTIIRHQLEDSLTFALCALCSLRYAARSLARAAARLDRLPPPQRAEAAAAIAASPLVQGVRQALRERYDAIEDDALASADTEYGAP